MDWLRSLSAAVRGAGDAELDYPPMAGSPRLREVLAAYRGRVRGTLATAADVIMCAGAAQAFITVADALGATAARRRALAARPDRGRGPGPRRDPRPARAGAGSSPSRCRSTSEGIVVDALPGRRARRARHARAPVPDRRRAQPGAPRGAAAAGPSERGAIDRRGRLRRRVPLRPRAGRRAPGPAAGPRRPRRLGLQDARARAAARLADRAARRGASGCSPPASGSTTACPRSSRSRSPTSSSAAPTTATCAAARASTAAAATR